MMMLLMHSPLVTGVTWPGVTWADAMEEEEATPGGRVRPRETLPGSMLPSLPVLRCGCVEGQAWWVG